MGKKSKQKKQRQQQIRQQMGQVQAMPMQTMTSDQAPAQTMTTSARVAGLELGEQYIRRDIIRILILLGIVAIVMITLFIVGDKTSAITTAGHKLATLMRLQ